MNHFLGYVRLTTTKGNINLELHCEHVSWIFPRLNYKKEWICTHTETIFLRTITHVNEIVICYRTLLWSKYPLTDQTKLCFEKCYLKIWTSLNLTFALYDLYTLQVQKTCENFIKHCQSGYYNNTSMYIFFTINYYHFFGNRLNIHS